MLPELAETYSNIVKRLGFQQAKSATNGPSWRAMCEYEGPCFRLRFKKERDDFWVEVARAGEDRGWTDLTVYRNFLEGRDPLEHATLQEIAEFLERNVGSITALLEAAPDSDVARQYGEFLRRRGDRMFPEWSQQ